MCGRPENIRKCVYGLDEFGWDYFGLLLLLALKSNQLPTCAYFSNFIIFDKKTGDALRLLMQMTTVNAILIKTDGIGIFNFPFSFETFLMVCGEYYILYMWLHMEIRFLNRLVNINFRYFFRRACALFILNVDRSYFIFSYFSVLLLRDDKNSCEFPVCSTFHVCLPTFRF